MYLSYSTSHRTLVDQDIKDSLNSKGQLKRILIVQGATSKSFVYHVVVVDHVVVVILLLRLLLHLVNEGQIKRHSLVADNFI